MDDNEDFLDGDDDFGGDSDLEIDVRRGENGAGGLRRRRGDCVRRAVAAPLTTARPCPCRAATFATGTARSWRGASASGTYSAQVNKRRRGGRKPGQGAQAEHARTGRAHILAAASHVDSGSGTTLLLQVRALERPSAPAPGPKQKRHSAGDSLFSDGASDNNGGGFGLGGSGQEPARGGPLARPTRADPLFEDPSLDLDMDDMRDLLPQPAARWVRRESSSSSSSRNALMEHACMHACMHVLRHQHVRSTHARHGTALPWVFQPRTEAGRQ